MKEKVSIYLYIYIYTLKIDLLIQPILLVIKVS